MQRDRKHQLSYIAKKKMIDFDHRVKSLWSYDVLNNSMFRDVGKIKTRVVEELKKKSLKDQDIHFSEIIKSISKDEEKEHVL
jgi:hypothetical protein